MTVSYFNHLALDDFERARRKVFWRNLRSRLTGKPNKLLSFDDIANQLRHKRFRYLGLQSIPIDKIVGSEGRHHEFDGAFYPRQRSTRDRWMSIDQAHYQAIPLPPVELLKIGQIYFVRDGNHRVSVARVWGQIVIDAYVTEIGMCG